MVTQAVWASAIRGAGLYGLLGAGATLAIVEYMAGVGGTQGRVLGGTILAVGVMLLLLGGLLSGGFVGLRHRGNWREAFPAGLLTGTLGYVLQLVVVVGLLSAIAALIAIGPGGEGWALPAITPLQIATIFLLSIPAGFVSASASLVASTMFHPGEETTVLTTAVSVPVHEVPAKPARPSLGKAMGLAAKQAGDMEIDVEEEPEPAPEPVATQPPPRRTPAQGYSAHAAPEHPPTAYAPAMVPAEQLGAPPPATGYGQPVTPGEALGAPQGYDPNAYPPPSEEAPPAEAPAPDARRPPSWAP